MSKKDLAALFHALSGAAALIGSIMTRGQISIAAHPAKAIGFAVFGLGCLLFTYALAYLREAFKGNVDPVTKKLVTGGPYRLIRHPVYLAMLVMCLGLAIGTRSWLGIALTAFLFLPSAVYRARLEDAALDQAFGDEWRAYARRSRFMLPFVF